MRDVARRGAPVLLAAAAAACTPLAGPDPAPPAAIETSIFLIGDAGEASPRDVWGVLDSLKAQVASAPGGAVIVFLGDNIYPAGMPPADEPEWQADAVRRMEKQIAAVPANARAIFVPGNHDWAREGPFGLQSIRLEGELIDRLAAGRDIRLLPANGCPGPAVVDLPKLRIVAIDTQWWLHPFIVHDAASDCTADPGDVTQRLREALSSKDRMSIVVGHHPMMTGGQHGGYCGISAPFHRFAGSSQDILSRRNETMRDSLDAAFAPNPPIAYIAGHEHTLQVLRRGAEPPLLLVSGAGSPGKVSCAVRMRESYYVSQNRMGFMRLDVMKQGGVMLSVFHYSGDGVGERSYARWVVMP